MGGLNQKRILFCGYREWAIDIFNALENWTPKFKFDLATSVECFEREFALREYDAIFFIGWSWIIDCKIINSTPCVCLHPSPLPKYRGGSPLQHQIINGEDASAVTLFIMDDELDHGPVVWQEQFSLSGNLSDIFARITNLGTRGIKSICDDLDFIKRTEQNHAESTLFRRRKPSDSEITLQDFSAHTAKSIYNKVRALQDPYPNAYIVCEDGTKLFIKDAYYE
jgi:methionyl-tRNA formyltransferase